jgi:hypothetical protein
MAMLLPLVFILSLQDAVAPVAPSFSVAPVVASPDRLAMTPKIDGSISSEEWDPFSSVAGVSSFVQWEPGKLHFAGKVPKGSDLLISVDFGRDGWLVGRNNYEFRIGMRDGQPFTLGRLSDGTDVNGPRWVDLPGLAAASVVAATSDSVSTTYEATFADPGMGIYPTEPGERIALRCDAVPSGSAPIEAYVPRVLAPVKLGFTRDAGLPESVKYAPEGQGIHIYPGQAGKVRLTFQGKQGVKLDTLSLRTEGEGRAVTNQLTTPFPLLDNKGRAFVDYNTNVAPTATEGWRVLRGELSSSDGVPGILETSYRISPLVDCDLIRTDLRTQDVDRSERIGFYVESNSLKNVFGKVTVEVPEPFRSLNGNVKTFSLSQKGKMRRAFDIYVPAKIDGSFAIVFHIEAGNVRYDQIGYITVRR